MTRSKNCGKPVIGNNHESPFIVYKFNTHGRYNVSTTREPDTGILDKDGFNYTGILGMLQRDEADAANAIFPRLDSIAKEGVFKMGAAMAPDDLTIMAYKEKDNEVPIDVTSVVIKTIDNLTYNFILIVIFGIAAVLMAASSFMLMKDSEFRPKRMIRYFRRQYFEFAMQMFQLAIDRRTIKQKEEAIRCSGSAWLSQLSCLYSASS